MGNYKAGCPPAHPILGFSDISLAGKPNIVGIGGANMKWRHPSCYHKRENTAFNLVLLQGPWELVVFHVRKGAKFGVQKIMVAEIFAASVGNGKNCENYA